MRTPWLWTLWLGLLTLGMMAGCTAIQPGADTPATEVAVDPVPVGA